MKLMDYFFNVPSAACLILCRGNSAAHRWLITEAIPEELWALILKQYAGPQQNRACKTFVECLIIGKQYGLTLPRGEPRERVEYHLQSLLGVGHMMDRILNS